ncbi:MAG: SpoIIE family protein phosphatase [Spirochaetes bacterium]|jgi:serine phosphatase RsbU (regulator of sigma subunit)|nr:SpoIIE family protein phosphatase [Spirochaetota bacterium]
MITTIPIAIVSEDDYLPGIISKVIRSFKVDQYLSIENFTISSGFIETNIVIIDFSSVNLSIEDLDTLSGFKNKIHIIGVVRIEDYHNIDADMWKHVSEVVLKPFHPNSLVFALDRSVKQLKGEKSDGLLISEFKKYSEQLERNTAQANIRSSKFNNDLDMASNLQECLYPKDLPDIRNIRFASKYRSLEKISGDFYHFEKFSSNRFSLLFADVSGHGVTAALYSAMVKSAISSINFERVSPAEVVKRMNKFLISAQKKPSYNYVTICYSSFDLKKQKVTYCNAGLPAPLLISNNNVKKMNNTGPFVGIFDAAEYQEESEKFVPGDKMLFFTDGAYEDIEDFNIKKGYQKVFSIVDKNKAQKINEIVEEMFAILENTPIKNDDSTYLGIEYIK